MGDSSDSEEFYDAEEFTPVRGSKWVCLHNIRVLQFLYGLPVVTSVKLPRCAAEMFIIGYFEVDSWICDRTVVL